MTDSSTPFPWIDLADSDDHRDVVHRAVACLAQGGVVGLGTETVYCLTASALHVESVARVRELRGAPASRPLTLLLKGPEEVGDWVPQLSRVGQRLARRLWPGPLALIFARGTSEGLAARLPSEVKPLVSPAGEIALRCPADPFLADVLGLNPAPLVLAMVTQLDGTPAVTADPMRKLIGLDMVIDAGPTRYQKPATAVRIDDGLWSVEREGVIDARTLTQMSGMILLFVCTGNTCRSPMAEAICKVLLSRRLNCQIDQLESRGFLVRSAGIAASIGAPAATHAVDVLRELGGTLERHRSRKVTLDMVRQADCVFAMTIDHLEALVDAVPEVQANAFLLDPHGGDVSDPFGSDHENYRRTAAVIERLIEQRLGQMGI